MNRRYLQIFCQFPESWQDSVSTWSAESGSLGWEEHLKTEKSTPGMTQWIIFFPEDTDSEEIVSALRADLAGQFGTQPVTNNLVLQVETVDEYDWASQVQKTFQPVPISDRLWIIPSWQEVQEQHQGTIIRIDPGQAFGTGWHESTKLCLLLLEKFFEERKNDPPQRALDIGCGSGILALYAAQHGVNDITAIDIDPLAVENTKLNFQNNPAPKVLRVLEAGPEDVKEEFPLVLANLEKKLLHPLKEVIPRMVTPGGHLLLSGLLIGEEGEILDHYSSHGFELADEIRMNEWISLLLEKTK